MVMKRQPKAKRMKLAESADSQENRPQQMISGGGYVSNYLNAIEKGSSGTDVTGGFFSEEYLQKLQGSRGAKIYDEMFRSEPQVRMLLTAAMNPIKRANWEVEPDPNTENSELHAKFIDFNLKQMISFETFKHEALSLIKQGYSLFEVVHQVVENHPKFGTFIGLKALGFRSQKTIERWGLEKGTGKILWVEQLTVDDIANSSRQIMSGEHLIVFSNDKEGDNYEGISALRSMYGPWIRKNLYLKLAAIGVEKYAIGTPVGTVPAGKSGNQQEINGFEAVLENYTSNEKAYIIKPEGWEIEIQKQDFDAEKIKELILLENTEMINSMVANFLALGMNSGGGAYALGLSLIDFFTFVIQSYADLIAEGLNRCLIPSLIKMNFGPQEGYPTIKVSGIDDNAGKEFADSIRVLKDGGLIRPDNNIETYLRKLYKLPKLSEEMAAQPIPQTSPAQQQSMQFSENSKKFDEKFTKVIESNSELLEKTMRGSLTDAYKSIQEKLRSAYKKSSASSRNSAFTQVDSAAIKSAYSKVIKEELAKVAFESVQKTKATFPLRVRRKLSESDHIDTMRLADTPRGGFFDALSPKIKKLVKSQSELIAETQINDLEKVVYFQFASSAAASEDIDSILNDIDEKVNPTLGEDTAKVGNIVTAAGDAVAQVANQSRIETYFEEDAFDEIESFTFVNEDPVSEICKSLDGVTLSPKDPDFMRYQTPLHHNCKSHWEANFKGDSSNPDIERGLSLSKKALDSVTL